LACSLSFRCVPRSFQSRDAKGEPAFDEHGNALLDCNRGIKTPKVTANFTSDRRSFCARMGAPAPFLPVQGKEEYKHFDLLVRTTCPNLDFGDMALKWCAHVGDIKNLRPRARPCSRGLTRRPCQRCSLPQSPRLRQRVPFLWLFRLNFFRFLLPKLLQLRSFFWAALAAPCAAGCSECGAGGFCAAGRARAAAGGGDAVGVAGGVVVVAGKGGQTAAATPFLPFR
jgi:hypothetical protein